MVHWFLETQDPEDDFTDISEPDLSLRAYKAAKKGKNPDLPNYREAMEGPHAVEFKQAMQLEIESLEKWGTWQGVLRKSIPPGAKMVPLTWVFQIKRLPNGDFSKFKARLCV